MKDEKFKIASIPPEQSIDLINTIINADINAVDKDVLLNAPDSDYRTILVKYPDLKEIKMNENRTKATHPIHIILGASDFTKIKTQERPRIGQIGDPVVELTKLGWVIMSPGKDSSYSNVLLRTAALNTYKELCSLDVLTHII